MSITRLPGCTTTVPLAVVNCSPLAVGCTCQRGWPWLLVALKLTWLRSIGAAPPR